MKLIKPFNQLRSILPSAVGPSGYRFLCIFMTALLFCGMNSQVMAASVSPGANNNSNNNAPASGDKFNSESFLKASNPNADASQQWTWGEKIGAGILGAALLGGAVGGGYKYHADRNARIAEEQQNEASRNRTDSCDGKSPDLTGRENSENLAAQATDSSIVVNGTSNVGDNAAPGWKQKASDALAAFVTGAYDLATLKSCWPAAKEVVAAPEKPLMVRLTEARAAQLKKELADAKAMRSWGTTIYDLLTLKSDVLPSDQTAMMKEAQDMVLLGKIKNNDITLEDKSKYQKHINREDERKKEIEDLTPESSPADMYNVMDHEVATALNKFLWRSNSELPLNNRQKRMLYFVAKNPVIHPGHIAAMKNLSEDLGANLTFEINSLWNKNDIDDEEKGEDIVCYPWNFEVVEQVNNPIDLNEPNQEGNDVKNL